MRPEELRHSLFKRSHGRPTVARHTLLCLTCGSLQDFDAETSCTGAESHLLPPEFLAELARLSEALEADREDVLRGLLAVALASLERGGTAAHVRAIDFLESLEEAEALTSEPAGMPGPRGLVAVVEPAAAEKRT